MKRHLKFDLLRDAARKCVGNARDLVKRAGQLLYCLDQCRAVQRPLSRLAPPFDGSFSEARLGEVMRQQLRLGRSG